MMIVWLLASVALAGQADWPTLTTEAGWEHVATPSTKDTGDIDLSLKTIAGTPCLRGTVTVEVSPQTLYSVAVDIPGALKFSSETLLASRMLREPTDQLDYYQHLDVPDWTMAADRYWVLRAETRSEGDLRGLRWDRFDWRADYPELASELDRNHADAVEPQVNWGQWIFEPNGTGTNLTYYLCNDPGGSLPKWLQKAAATKTLPGAIADVVREGKRRASNSG